MEIKEFEPRLYQEKIFSSSTNANTLAVLPTGLGKTFIALMLALHRLKQFPGSKIIFMAPTKPLCDQHMKTFLKHITKVDEEDMALVTGMVSPNEREKLYKKTFIFATPQTIANDIISRILNPENFSLIVFDEAHRAVGEYDYVFIAKQYMRLGKDQRILALTASPGSDRSAINEICKNLFITNIESRDEDSEDVIEYMMDKKIEKIMIELPDELKEIKDILERCLKRRLEVLKQNNVIQSADLDKVRKSQLLMLQGSFAAKAKGNWFLMRNISVIAAAIKTMHCLDLLQTQGIRPLASFFITLKEQATKTKASKSLLEDLEFKEAMQRIFELESKGVEHPKYKKLVELMQKYTTETSRIIIFTQYRNTADCIIDFIRSVKGVRPIKFIGQKSGMSQKEQINTIKEFKDGVYNVLVCTSIGEEGLHIENADLGIFFEPVPSALRSIQRRGRIGRVNIGEVITLITKDTIDEKYYWVAFHKEKRMKNAIKEIQDSADVQKDLKGFDDGISQDNL
jgi:Fanconi anemia group M protein